MERRLIQTKYATNFLTLSEKTVSQTFKSSSCKSLSQVCVLLYNLLRWMFFIPCDNWKALFFIQIYCYIEVWYNRHVDAFFKGSVLKDVFYIRNPHNNITMLLIPKVQNKTSNYVLNNIYLSITFFTLSVCKCFTFCFINGIFQT